MPPPVTGPSTTGCPRRAASDWLQSKKAGRAWLGQLPKPWNQRKKPVRGNGMRWPTEIWLRFRGLVWRTRLDRDLDTEMEFHLQMRQLELEESGMSSPEARHAASR